MHNQRGSFVEYVFIDMGGLFLTVTPTWVLLHPTRVIESRPVSDIWEVFISKKKPLGEV